MKFTTQTEYAIELMVQLCRNKETVGLPELIRQANIGTQRAGVTMQRLRAAGLISSVRGCNGGYQLSRANITLWDIVQAVEGPVEPQREVSASVRHGYALLAQSVTKSLGGVSLQALARG